jgi:hypothetical protein
VAQSAHAPAQPAAAAGCGGGSSCCGVGVTHHLVAYPAKDNYEGRMYPLDWIQRVGTCMIVFARCRDA